MNKTVKGIAFGFSFAFLGASAAASVYTGEGGQLWHDFVTICTSPSPLVTDYYALGSLPAAFLNAGLCGLAMALMMLLLKVECVTATLAGYFLVVAHCFYGLNFVNMWPPIFGILLYCFCSKLDFRGKLDWAMFSTAFGPFFGELLFRYTLGDQFQPGSPKVTLLAVVLVIVLAVFLGFFIPAMLPGALRMHKGFNLYNGGLAFGLLGLLIYAFMYKTMGRTKPEAYALYNESYEAMGHSYALFINVFFIIVFSICLLIGWNKNHRSFRGYGRLLAHPGYKVNFFQEFGSRFVLINLGFYGLMMLLYYDLIIGLTDGAGFTGATTGVILAAMTFVAAGQHPANVWPVLSGYVLLSVFVTVVCYLTGDAIPWTLSTQAYMNGAAFATGLCPLSGKYGKGVGILAGVVCAIMCTSTTAMHGGFVLYNGGLTAGFTALILVPFLEYYFPDK